MSRLLNFSLCLALTITSLPAHAADIAGPPDTYAAKPSYELAQLDQPEATTPAKSESGDQDYRLEPKKKSTGKKVATGALIALGVVGAAVLGLLAFRRAQCGPGYRDCSE